MPYTVLHCITEVVIIFQLRYVDFGYRQTIAFLHSTPVYFIFKFSRSARVAPLVVRAIPRAPPGGASNVAYLLHTFAENNVC